MSHNNNKISYIVKIISVVAVCKIFINTLFLTCPLPPIKQGFFIMTKEIWKSVPNYEGIYEVSNTGKIKSLERRVKKTSIVRESMLKPHLHNGRYLRVSLSKKNKRKFYRVHQLVAMAFLGHKPCKYEKVVDHIDNNPLNNNLKNLQIISHRQNCSKDKKNYTSKYVGVNWCSFYKKWRSRIYHNGKTIFLGYFKDEYQAHLAYQKKLKSLPC